MGVTSEGVLAFPPATIGGNELVRGYQPELDVVRFLAFLFVFLHHFLTPIVMSSLSRFALADRVGSRVLLSLDEASAMGLCLFFALSAYLITGLLLGERKKNGNISVRKFYIRRILRIWPLYFFGVALGICIALLLHEKSDLFGFLWFLLFAGNFYGVVVGPLHNPMSPLWSISIEEQFYLLWPWAMRWFFRRGLSVCALIFIIAANITLFRFGQRHANTDISVWSNTFVHFEMFASGILLALAKKRADWHHPWTGCVLALAGPSLWFVACFVFHAKQPLEAGAASSGIALMIGYALIALGCAAVIQGFCIIGPSYMPRWVAGLGKISYGLYVYHLLAIEFAHACFASLHGLLQLVASVALAFLLTVSAAIISYALLESPFLRLKRRFETLHTRPI